MSKYSNRYTDEDLLNEIRNVYNELGRVPNVSDFFKRTPNASTFRRFGSWKNALSLAGLKKEKVKSTDYTDEYLLNCMIEYYHKTNKIPTIRGMKKEGYPTAHAYINHFGSFKNALIKIELYELRKDKHQFCNTYTDEELLIALNNYMKNKNRIPTNEMMRKDLSPSVSTFDKRFGSVFNAFKLIGYDYEKQQEQDLIDLENDMIDKYKKLKEIIGIVPSSRDIDKYCQKYNYGYSMSAYEFHFGSLYELQILCGFTPTIIGKNKSKEDLLDDLIRISYELDRTPSQNDLKYFNDIASSSKYTGEFGSWNEAIKLAGLKPNNDTYYSSKGIVCLSYYELLFTNMLEEYNIKFLKEEPYRKYINTDRLYRFDYIIDIDNKRFFIEIFGITSKEDYYERTKNKIQLCEENNIDLIEIYPKDFTSYKLEDIHKMYEEKLINIK